MNNVATKEELSRILDISSVADIDLSNIQNKIVDVVKNNKIPAELFEYILEKAPVLIESFNKVFKTMADVGNSLEETKRHRWQTIQELGKQGKLSGSQILEAMGILGEIEKNESIDWNSHFKTIISIMAVVAVIIVSKK